MRRSLRAMRFIARGEANNVSALRLIEHPGKLPHTLTHTTGRKDEKGTEIFKSKNIS